MKSLLRFILLFALIIIGKIAKEPTGLADVAKAIRLAEQLPIHPVSVLQPGESQSAAPAGDSQMWRLVAPANNTTTSSFQ